MTLWYDGPLAAFDTKTTGVDVERDRVVSASVVVQDAAGGPPRITRWLVGPGVPVPAAAVEAHGLTDDRLRRDGRWPAPVLEEVARSLAEQCAAARPLVVVDAPFGLTLLDRELRRHRAAPLSRYLEHVSLCVLDPRVLDRQLDRYRKGPRTLTDLRERYGVSSDGTPDTVADALAALEVTRAVGRRFAARLERLSAPELHTLQAVWHAAHTRGPQAWFARGGAPDVVDPAWPLRTELRASV
ncbi:exonuclease domain-containing protein [Streptomyces sp. NPDC020965]|uniref:exonuclease domain-containing protein n=1 Tax=Streptomyces sp. NPDC020965 TaxID=3365105 RepID=UPI00379F9E0E